MIVNKTCSIECASYLNEAVRQNIENSLWIICNFNSTPIVQCSDARVIKKIQDMYIFFIDVGLFRQINKQYHNSKEGGIFKELVDKVERRRSAWDHCTSEDNGTNGDRIWYENWVKSIIGKKEPESEEEWEKIYQELCLEEYQMIEIYEKFINGFNILSTEKKGKIVRDWKLDICNWYSLASGKHAIIGQWEKIYKANNPNCKVSRPYSKLSKDVENQFLADYKALRKNVTLNAELSSDNVEKLLNRIDEKMDQIIDIIRGETEGNWNDNQIFAEWFMKKVVSRIKHYCDNGVPDDVESLLPQDIIQYIVLYDIPLEIQTIKNKVITGVEQQSDNTIVSEKLSSDYQSEATEDDIEEIPIIETDEEVVFYPIEFKHKVVQGRVNGILASLNKKALTNEQKGIIKKAIVNNTGIVAKMSCLNPQGTGYILHL